MRLVKSLKRKNTFCLVFLLISTIFTDLKAQCKNDLFNVTFVQPGARTFSDLISLPSNRLILCGSTGNSLNLLKINTQGDTIFSKFISPVAATTPGTSVASVLHTDKTLFNTHFGSVIHTDTNANVLSIKQIVTSSNTTNRLDITKIGILQNGDLLILGKSTSGYFLVRSSTDLKTVYWSKHVRMQNTNVLTLLIDRDQVLVAGYYNDGSFSGLDAPYLALFNTSNGNLIRATALDRVSGYSTRINQIIKTGNDYLIEISHLKKNFDPKDVKYIIRMDSLFTIRTVKRIKSVRTDNNQEFESMSYRLLEDRDGGYFINASANASFTPLAVSKVSNEDEIKWNSSVISIPIGFGDLTTTAEGLIVSSVSVYNNVQLNRTETSIAFAKLSFSGEAVNCFSTIKINNILTDTIYSKQMIPSSHEIKDSSVTWVDIDYSNRYIQTTLSRKCSSPGLCESVRLEGPTKVCNSDPLIYTGKRNANCFNRVDWEIVPGKGVSNKILTDSTISLSFLMSGRYLLVSRLFTSCGVISDSIYIDASLNNLSLGRDTSLCPGQTIRLSAGNLFNNYVWQDGSTDSFLVAMQPGKYWVTTTNSACSTINSDTILITAGQNYQFPQRKQIETCFGQSVDLTAETGFITYQWYPDYKINIQTSQKVTVTPDKDTSYTVIVTDSLGCTGKDSFSIKVNPYPNFSFPTDTLLCDNAIVRFDVGQSNPSSSYLWQDGTTASSFIVSKPGTYQVTVGINGCLITKAGIFKYQLTPTINLGRDTIKCNEDVITLDVTFPDANYLWQDGKTSPVYQVQNSGAYYCTVSNGCGIVRDTVIIQNEICECNIDAPNIFSPNGDGTHDYFSIFTKCRPVEYSLFIYNRNGQVVFTSNSLNKFWDGTFQNKPAPIGTYYYYIKIRGTSEKVARQKAGSITLIR